MTGPSLTLKSHGLDSRCSAGGCGLAIGASAPLDVLERAPAMLTGPKLLEFESQSCAACKKMAPIMRELEAKCAKGHDIVQHVDVVGDEGEALAAQYGIRVIPTFVAVDDAGHEVMRLSGMQATEKMAAVISEVTGDRCTAVD